MAPPNYVIKNILKYLPDFYKQPDYYGLQMILNVVAPSFDDLLNKTERFPHLTRFGSDVYFVDDPSTPPSSTLLDLLASSGISGFASSILYPNGAALGSIVTSNRTGTQFGAINYGTGEIAMAFPAPPPIESQLFGISYQYDSLALEPPSPPQLYYIIGGSLPSTTYFVVVTYVNSYGETTASVESSLFVPAGNLLGVHSPTNSGNATGYNVYVGTQSGAETKQNSSPISLGVDWRLPSTGLISGSAPPPSNTTGNTSSPNHVSYVQKLLYTDGYSQFFDVILDYFPVVSSTISIYNEDLISLVANNFVDSSFIANMMSVFGMSTSSAYLNLNLNRTYTQIRSDISKYMEALRWRGTSKSTKRAIYLAGQTSNIVKFHPSTLMLRGDNNNLDSSYVIGGFYASEKSLDWQNPYNSVTDLYSVEPQLQELRPAGLNFFYSYDDQQTFTYGSNASPTGTTRTNFKNNNTWWIALARTLPWNQVTQTIGTGNGSTTTFSSTLYNTSVVAKSVNVVAGSVSGLDNGSGSIVGNGVSGTINYTSGAVSVTFTTAPASGIQVNVSYQGSTYTDTNPPPVSLEPLNTSQIISIKRVDQLGFYSSFPNLVNDATEEVNNYPTLYARALFERGGFNVNEVTSFRQIGLYLNITPNNSYVGVPYLSNDAGVINYSLTGATLVHTANVVPRSVFPVRKDFTEIFAISLGYGTTFTVKLSHGSIVPRSFFLDIGYTFVGDTGSGTLYGISSSWGGVSGTLYYSSGYVVLNLPTPLPAGTVIRASYQWYDNLARVLAENFITLNE